MTTFIDPATADSATDLIDSADVDTPDIDITEEHISPHLKAESVARPHHGQPAGKLLWLDPHKLIRARNRPLKLANPDVTASSPNSATSSRLWL